MDKQQTESLNRDDTVSLPAGSEESARQAELKALHRRKWKHIFHKPLADYFVLEIVLLGNVVHFLFMLIMTLLKRRDYLFMTFHFNIPDGEIRFLKLLVLFLLPSLLVWIFAILFRLLERKKKIWRILIRVAAGIALAVTCTVALVQSAIFEPTFPLASYTEKAKNIGTYDRVPASSLPSTNCPDLTRFIPEGAENIEYSYWYIHIMDHEWTIHVSYTLPEDTYQELKETIVAQYDAMHDIQITEQDGVVTYDTVDYRENLSRARTTVAVTFEDDIRKIDYTLSSFLYDGYLAR